MSKYTLAVYQDRGGRYRWRIVCTKNGEYMASSSEGDGYSTRSNAVRAARRLRLVAWLAKLVKE